MAQIYVGTIIEFPVRLLGGIVSQTNTEACGGLKYLPPTYVLFLSVARGAFPPFFDVPIRTVYVEYVLHTKIVPSSSRRGEAPIGLST